MLLLFHVEILILAPFPLFMEPRSIVCAIATAGGPANLTTMTKRHEGTRANAAVVAAGSMANVIPDGGSVQLDTSRPRSWGIR